LSISSNLNAKTYKKMLAILAAAILWFKNRGKPSTQPSVHQVSVPNRLSLNVVNARQPGMMNEKTNHARMTTIVANQNPANKPTFARMTPKQRELRRNHDEPLGIEAYRAYGQLLHLSGHPDELYNRKFKTMSLGEIQRAQTEKWRGQNYLLNSHNFNANGITRRQQFAGPSDEIHFPMQEHGSAWYAKATVGRKPYVTRILPWTIR